jgi:hypothetical protein
MVLGAKIGKAVYPRCSMSGTNEPMAKVKNRLSQIRKNKGQKEERGIKRLFLLPLSYLTIHYSKFLILHLYSPHA